MDAKTMRKILLEEVHISTSEATDVELFCLQTPVVRIGAIGQPQPSQVEHDEARGKCRSRAVEVLRWCRENGIPLSDIQAILQTADWKN